MTRLGTNARDVAAAEIDVHAIVDALEHRAFTIFVQPIVLLAGRRPVGAETLLRWARGGDMLVPAHFVERARRSGLLGQLGDVAVATALSVTPTADSWLTVNLWPEQLLDSSLPDRLANDCRRRALDPNRLVLEVSELTPVEVVLRARSMLQRLRAHGMRVALDDFGAPGMDADLCDRLSPDIVKVDRSVLVAARRSTAARCRLKSAVEWATARSLPCVVEGIETEAELRIAVDAGADLGQGYLFGRPVQAIFSGS